MTTPTPESTSRGDPPTLTMGEHTSNIPPLELFQDEICRKYASRRCNDLDLLIVSRKAAENSVLAVGTCLHLDASEIEKVESDSEKPKRNDKIHQLLVKWKNKNISSATWENLVQHLDILSDESLMKGIQAYLHEQEPPSTQDVLQPGITKQQCCMHA